MDLIEGQEVSLTIVPGMIEKERIRAALGDLVAEYPYDPSPDDIDEELEGKQVNLSDAIIEERRESP